MTMMPSRSTTAIGTSTLMRMMVVLSSSSPESSPSTGCAVTLLASVVAVGRVVTSVALGDPPAESVAAEIYEQWLF